VRPLKIGWHHHVPADDPALVFPFLRHVTSIGDPAMKDRSYFKHRIDMLDGDGEIIEHLAGAEDFMLAEALYEAAIKRWPKSPILLRKAAWVDRDSRRPRLVK
jgi:hypothetical protein